MHFVSAIYLLAFDDVLKRGRCLIPSHVLSALQRMARLCSRRQFRQIPGICVAIILGSAQNHGKCGQIQNFSFLRANRCASSGRGISLLPKNGRHFSQPKMVAKQLIGQKRFLLVFY